ncbi:Retrovirus-related Pol polyprotein from transposon RE1 [Glycine soja]
MIRFMHEPKQVHMTTAKRVLRYLKGIQNFGVMSPNEAKQEEEELIGHSNFDWCRDKIDTRSITACIFEFSGASISWCSKKQPVVALSSCEAEYIARAFATCQAETTQTHKEEANI